ncbi:MAG: poly(A) polymerase, partial [Desulfobulbus sp.]
EKHTIIDYTGGVADLDRGLIRVVGDPDRRFTRDPVRMMRAIRHSARTGFAIEGETLAAVRRHSDKLRLCPPSRLRDEVLKDLQSGASRRWAELCMSSSLWNALFPLYREYLQGEEGAVVRDELMRVFSVLDRLHSKDRGDDEPIKVPEFFLLATLLLPWACQRYKLPDTNVRGQGFHRLSRMIRDDVDHSFGEPFNVQRMAKESMTTLLINLSTFHHTRSQGGDPKWLKKKSYYKDCSRFYDFYLEMQGIAAVQPDRFVVEPAPAEAMEVISLPEEGNGHSGARGRRGVNPAFSSKTQGVFGLRKTHG